MNKPNPPPLIVPDRTNFKDVHDRMYKRVQERLRRAVLRKLAQGDALATSVGLIMDCDDAVWRDRLHCNRDLPAIRPVPPGSQTGRLLSATTRRSDIIRLTEKFLPALSEYFSQPAPTGFIHVMVLGVGTASPYTLHWASKLEFKWE